VTVLMLSELGRAPDQRAQEEFELGAVTFRCPDCLHDDAVIHHLAGPGGGGLRKCRRCGEWWRPGVWERSLRVVAPEQLEVPRVG
jgi:transcription elongation factor Elf1